jgi:hypothetical protein
VGLAGRLADRHPPGPRLWGRLVWAGFILAP